VVSFSSSYRDCEVDPKLAWALEHRDQFPVDVNHASRESLLRVPGLTPSAVDRLLQWRCERPLSVADVRKLRVNWYQLRYFIATRDHCPRQRVPQERPTAVSFEAPAGLTGLPLFDAV
jgi:predicted DNA-binding helix-hairpin-helix protein